jgi:DnaK suppressor protein
MSHLSPEELTRFRHRLERERALLVERQHASAPVRRGVGDPEIEEGDVAERIVEQDVALSRDELDGDRLVDINRALQKLEEGSYGRSEESGDPIPIARLEAVPWARRTAEEEERLERGPR